MSPSVMPRCGQHPHRTTGRGKLGLRKLAMPKPKKKKITRSKKKKKKQRGILTETGQNRATGSVQKWIKINLLAGIWGFVVLRIFSRRLPRTRLTHSRSRFQGCKIVLVSHKSHLRNLCARKLESMKFHIKYIGQNKNKTNLYVIVALIIIIITLLINLVDLSFQFYFPGFLDKQTYNLLLLLL